MRIFEQFSKIIVQAIFKKEQGFFDEAKLDLQDACEKMLGLNFTFLKSQSSQDLINLLKIGGTEYEKFLLLAELFKEEGEILEKQGLESYLSFEKSFYLFTEGFQTQDSDLKIEFIPKVQSVISELKKYQLPTDLEEQISNFENQFPSN